MINFKTMDDSVYAVMDQNDGSTIVIAVRYTDIGRSDKWKIIDDKMDAASQIVLAHAITIAELQLNHVAFIRELFRR